MAIDVRSSLNRALKGLHAERARIDRQISALAAAVSELGGKVASRVAAGGRKSKRRKSTRTMNAAQKRAVSVRMKAYWAKRRASK